MGSRGVGRSPPDISKLHSLLVLNISFRTTVAELRSEFEKYGELGDVYIPRGNGGISKGYAFVRFQEKDDAEKARIEMDKKEMDGREIGVQIAKYGRPQGNRNSRRSPPPRRYSPPSSRMRRGRSISPQRRYGPPPGHHHPRRYESGGRYDRYPQGPPPYERRRSYSQRDESRSPGSRRYDWRDSSPDRKRNRIDDDGDNYRQPSRDNYRSSRRPLSPRPRSSRKPSNVVESPTEAAPAAGRTDDHEEREREGEREREREHERDHPRKEEYGGEQDEGYRQRYDEEKR